MGRGRKGGSLRPHEGQRSKTRVQRTTVSVRRPPSPNPHTLDPIKTETQSDRTQNGRRQKQTTDNAKRPQKTVIEPPVFRSGSWQNACGFVRCCHRKTLDIYLSSGTPLKGPSTKALQAQPRGSRMGQIRFGCSQIVNGFIRDAMLALPTPLSGLGSTGTFPRQ